MTNNHRSRQLASAAILLAGLSTACMSNPVAGESPADAGQDSGGGTVGSPGGSTGAVGGAGGVRTCPAGNSWCSGVGTATSFPVLLSPQREVDILFVIDNSPSMDPKQAALAANFPRMMEQLQNLSGGMPDVHIGVISSDMGAGGQGIGGNCNVVLGDRGLLWGNVPTQTYSYSSMQECYDKAPVRATVAPGSCWALAQNPPIANGCGLNSGARWIEDVQGPSGVGRQRNYTGNLADVFSCLAKAVGVAGCGYEHQLQSLRVALNPQQIGCDKDGKNCTDVNMANVGFLREEAYLAIILITDEDDCSAEPNNNSNDNIFTRQPRDPNGASTETASMRCAARGHICNGQPIPDYNDPDNGYTGSGFSTNFSDCAAKDQNMQSSNGLLPLITVQNMISSVTSVKPRPAQQILVSGIIGWPPSPTDTGLPSDLVVSDKYQIGKDATSIKGQNLMWDYMPICKVPSQKSSDGNIYKAYGGLRLKKFIDAFKRDDSSGLPVQNTFSICNSNFADAMTQIGQVTAQVITPASMAGCVQYPLVDADPSTPGTQPDCQVLERQPCDSTTNGACSGDAYADTPLFECKDAQGIPLNPTSLDPGTTESPLHAEADIDAVLATVPPASLPCWYLSYDHSAAGCPQAPKAQRISALRRAGAVAPAGTQLAVTCLICPASNPECTVATTGSGGT